MFHRGLYMCVGIQWPLLVFCGSKCSIGAYTYFAGIQWPLLAFGGSKCLTMAFIAIYKPRVFNSGLDCHSDAPNVQ